MKLSYKIKIFLSGTLILVLGTLLFIYIKNGASRKTEIKLGEKTSFNAPISQPGEELQSEINRAEPIENETESKIKEREAPAETENISPKKEDLKILNRLVTFGFESSSGRSIDTIIIHSSYDALGNDPYSVPGLIAEYKSYGVSPHYLIDRKGNIYHLVKDKNIAYHAGVSKVPDGRMNVNNFSLGVEIMETKTDSPTVEQYAALKNLLRQLKREYKIKYVLGHSQVSSGRKTDPWNFDWDKVK